MSKAGSAVKYDERRRPLWGLLVLGFNTENGETSLPRLCPGEAVRRGTPVPE